MINTLKLTKETVASTFSDVQKVEINKVMPFEDYCEMISATTTDTQLKELGTEYLQSLKVLDYLNTLDINIWTLSSTIYPEYAKFNDPNIMAFSVVNGKPILLLNLDKCLQVSVECGQELIQHELTHYDQWVRGDLEFNSEGMSWKGEPVGEQLFDLTLRMSKLDISAFKEYINLPWEREAFGIDVEPEREELLITNWCLMYNIKQ